MKIRLSTILSLGLAVGAGFVLFQTSQNVQQAERRLTGMQTALDKEKDAVRVLETEWDYLNRPDRLEELARGYLKMEAQSLSSLISHSGDLPQPSLPLIPARKPVRDIQKAVLRRHDVAPPPVTGEVPVESVLNAAERSGVAGAADGLPMPAPVANDTRQQFDTLLQNLIQRTPDQEGDGG